MLFNLATRYLNSA